MAIRRFALLPLVAVAGFVTLPRPVQDTVTRARVQPRTILVTVKGVPIFDTGYGSSIAVDPRHSNTFFLLADRGPNYDAGKDVKAFVRPDYAPRIGQFALRNGVLTQIARIDLSNSAGARLTGLPPAGGAGSTGETALTVDGARLEGDSAGVDPEGLVALEDGGFWVAEEYGPSLLHVNGAGRVIERIRPTGGVGALPQVLRRRRPNRGFEGVTLLPDGKTLVAVLESPLENPREAGRASKVTRLLAFDTQSGRSRQYLYVQDAVDDHNSDLVAISQTELLVLERDAGMPGDTSHPAAIKRVYRVDLTGATDVSDSSDRAEGMLLNGKTVESFTPEELAAHGVVAVRKSLVADLLALGYPHDKPEGITIINPSTIAISNDDDFGVTEGPAPKLLSTLKETDFNEAFIIHLATPLR